MATTTIPRPSAAASPARPGRLRSLVRGHADDPVWARPLLIALLAVTAVTYLIDLTTSGYSNSFYAAAVQAGTRSWKAFFFGSIDSSNFITVDKPPASLWVMELSGRLFGFSSASMLVPQVLEGVLSVALLAAAVKRWFGAGAGLLAGAALAVTPVAALMFRFNNPDALMVCLMVAAAYCMVRALERGGIRWIVAASTLLGFAFLAKMMEAFLVVPGFALVYMVAAPVGVRRRTRDLLVAGVALVVSSGWWVAIVALWPAASRPMIDGSSNNSILNLILDYNGLNRLSSSGPGGGGGANFSGPAGVLRLFNDVMGGQASWLLPAALIVLVGGLVWRLRAPRTDRLRAALLLWGSWLVVSAAVFSLSSGVIHTYYAVELAPAIGALAGIGAAVLWQRRDELAARLVMVLILAATAAWAVVLLQRTPSWQPWLTPLVIVSALAALGGVVAPAQLRRRLTVMTACAAMIACLAGPVAYTVETITTPHAGSVPSAGPTVSGAAGGFGGLPRGFAGAGGRAGSFGPAPDARGGLITGAAPARGTAGADRVSSALVKALESGASRFRWVAATSGSQSAASLELATGGKPVMAIGGFSGNGGNLTLAQFERYVRAGKIHYYVAGGAAGGFAGLAVRGAGAPSPTGSSGAPTGSSGAPFGGGAPPSGAITGGAPGAAGGPGGAGRGDTQAISAWVKAHYKAVTIGGQTVYDLTQPKG